MLREKVLQKQEGLVVQRRDTNAQEQLTVLQNTSTPKYPQLMLNGQAKVFSCKMAPKSTNDQRLFWALR
eukprot:10407459-Lingulodinium_polyedra.AAC.1